MLAWWPLYLTLSTHTKKKQKGSPTTHYKTRFLLSSPSPSTASYVLLRFAGCAHDQVDARLIKATVLDGDDIDAALEFLIKEGMQFGDLKPDKIPSLASNYVDADGTLMMPVAKKHYVTLNQDEQYLIDFSHDKHEESIVWKGGLVSHNLKDQGINYTNEGQGLDDFYESDSQQEEASMQGNERIDWWAATWSNATGLKEDDVLNSSSSFSSVQTDSEGQEEAGSHLWSDTELCKSIQQSVYWQKRNLDTDISSTGSTQSSLRHKTKGSSWGNVSGLKKFHKGCKSLVELGLPLSQDSFEVFPPIALDANMSEGGRPVSSSSNRQSQPMEVHTKDDNRKISSCQSVNMERDRAMQETSIESSRYTIDTEDLDKLLIEAKFRKENMRKDMDDIYLLRQQAEQEELVAQQAKAEATGVGLEILLKVEDVRQRMLRERAEYDMRAAEVYGERSVLSMEARELRSRLLETQAEQARALSLLDSVRCTLAARLQKASQEKQSAVMEVKLKEESALELLAREEESARTLVENFKALEAEAETCRKLREFLIKRGNDVDSLQGEMAVLCEDILNFKKQVDNGIPLSGSRSLSWSHMSHFTDQFVSTPLSSDIKERRSSRILALENFDFLKSVSNTSLLSLSSTTSEPPTSVGPIDCAMRSQYFSRNTSPIDTSDVGNEKGIDVLEAVEEIVDGLVMTACNNGQTQQQQEEDLNSLCVSKNNGVL